jgi:hypothetical protein
LNFFSAVHLDNDLRYIPRFSPRKCAQLVFCDLSTPKKGLREFSVYDDIRAKLAARGVPRLTRAGRPHFPEDF